MRRGGAENERSVRTAHPLCVNETGFLEKAGKSCGVARRYTGASGGTVNTYVTL